MTMPATANPAVRYGGLHQTERARWAPVVAAGHAVCHAVRCLEPTRAIAAGAAWDLGHTPDGTAWTGPEHPRCNRSEAAIRGNRARGQARRWML